MSAPYRTILVTGSSAVLGTALRAIAPERPESRFIFLTSKDCDLTDPAATAATFERHRPDAVLHLAAVSGGVGMGRKHPAKMLRDNVLMTFNVLDAARQTGVRKTVMTLSVGMYPANAPLPLNEDNIHDGPPHPSNYGYSHAKRLVEPALRAYREEFGLHAVGLIPSGIFGPNDNFNFEDAPMLPALIRRFYENRAGDQPVVIWGDGSPLREYTFSENVARIYLWALDHYDDPQVLNIGTNEEIAIRDIAFRIADLLKVDRRRIQFDTSKPAGIHRKPMDNSRFLRLSGFRYLPFRQGLEKTIAWFVDAYERDPASIRLYSKKGTAP